MENPSPPQEPYVSHGTNASIPSFNKPKPITTPVAFLWVNPLLTNKKVLLSPHAATFTKECVSDMAVQTAQNIIDFFEGKLNKNSIVNI